MLESKRTAYILQIHRNPEQVNSFIRQLIANEKTDVYIHIDKKKYNELYPKILKHPNVEILNNCIEVNWGDISQIDATLLLLKRVIESNKNYNFVCFRSGQDLLVKNGFSDYLKNNQNKIFISALPISKNNTDSSFLDISWPKRTRKQYNLYHPFRLFRRILMKLFSKGINLYPNHHKLPKEFVYFHGSQWFCMPFKVVEFIINFINNNKWYYSSFKNALCPDEWFFQTLIMNSNFKNDVENDNLMYIKWGETMREKNHPVILTSDNIPEITKSNSFFARKFDSLKENDIIDYYVKHVSM